MENTFWKGPETCETDHMMMINEKLEMDWRDDERM
jgi:hypothetical protein